MQGFFDVMRRAEQNIRPEAAHAHARLPCEEPQQAPRRGEMRSEADGTPGTFHAVLPPKTGYGPLGNRDKAVLYWLIKKRCSLNLF